MTKQTINVGAAVNDGTGDSLRNALIKTQGNFDELYTSVAAKEPAITAGTTAQYLRGDKSLATLNSTAVGLGNVNNTADTAKPISTLQQAALDLKVDEGLLTAGNLTMTTGKLIGRTTSGTGVVQELAPAAVKTLLVLDAVNNTADADKPVSTAQATAIATKANTVHTHVASDIQLTQISLVGKSTTGAGSAGELTVSQTKTLLLLNNVDNTSDANKPISTATQAALDTKAAQGGAVTIGQVSGLQTALNNKSDTTHTHDITTLTGFQTFSDSKANVVHTHVIADITGLAAQLVHSNKSFITTLTANARMASVVDTNYTFVVGNSKAVAGVAATASTVFDIRKNDVSIGSVTFDAGSVNGVIAVPSNGDRALVLGDVIEFVVPGSVDATLARVAFVLRN